MPCTEDISPIYTGLAQWLISPEHSHVLNPLSVSRSSLLTVQELARKGVAFTLDARDEWLSSVRQPKWFVPNKDRLLPAELQIPHLPLGG